jgi:hypothetical protein
MACAESFCGGESLDEWVPKSNMIVQMGAMDMDHSPVT